MPEGPEVRRHADALGRLLEGKPIVELSARNRNAKAWLEAHPDALAGRRIERIRSHGKNLVGWIEGGYYFYSHLMMWGRWQIVSGAAPAEKDRRERARIVVQDGAAILFSAPLFEVGEGDPYAQIEFLGRLGPDILPYPNEGPFNAEAFLARLLSPENRKRTVGAALLDQQISAGIGNYLRAEILFVCRIDPWRTVDALTTGDLDCLCETIPALALRSYTSGGVTVSDEDHERMKSDPSLVYQLGRRGGTLYYVFRRTNLPCLRCGDTIRQLRQMTHEDEEGEKTRIIYFCPTCQGTSVPLSPSKPKRAKTPVSSPPIALEEEEEPVLAAL